MPSIQAARASDFENSLGVQPDLNQGNFTNLEEIMAQAREAGIETLRLLMPTSNNWTTAEGFAQTLASAGFKLALIANTANTPEQNVAAVEGLLASHPGSVRMVEGPNEPNNEPFSYAGQTGNAAAVAWQADFKAALDASPSASAVPVYGFISFPNAGNASDYINLHPYPPNGDQPRARIQQDLAAQRAVESDPNKPWGITEIGFSTERPNAGTVDQATQAKLLLNAFFDAKDLGADHVGLYSLRDYPFNDFGAGFGINTENDARKPASVALGNVEAIFADAGAAAGSFAPTALDYSVSGAGVQDHLAQKSDGTYLLTLWNEPDIWDEASGAAIDPADVAATVTFGSNAYTVERIDPLAGTTGTNLGSVVQASATLDGSPIVLKISNPAPAGGPGVRLDGTEGEDTLVGGAGNDELFGWGRADVLDGAGGNDTLLGGWGNDTYTGGAGDDVFRAFWDGSAKTVTDFAVGQDKFEFYDWGNPASVAATVEQRGADTLLSWGGGSAVLEWVNAAALAASPSSFIGASSVTLVGGPPPLPPGVDVVLGSGPDSLRFTARSTNDDASDATFALSLAHSDADFALDVPGTVTVGSGAAKTIEIRFDLPAGNYTFDLSDPNATPTVYDDFSVDDVSFNGGPEIAVQSAHHAGGYDVRGSVRDTAADHPGTTITGTAGADDLHDGFGDDVVKPGGGYDQVWLDAGADTLEFNRGDGGPAGNPNFGYQDFVNGFAAGVDKLKLVGISASEVSIADYQNASSNGVVVTAAGQTIHFHHNGPAMSDIVFA